MALVGNLKNEAVNLSLGGGLDADDHDEADNELLVLCPVSTPGTRLQYLQSA